MDLRGPLEVMGKFLPKADVEDFEFDTDSEDEHELADQPLDVLHLMGKHSILEKEKMEHHQLARASFVLGVAMVDLNINKAFETTEDETKKSKTLSPLQNVKVAASISSGISEFMAGTLHGFQDQINSFFTSPQSENSNLFNVVSGLGSVGAHGIIYTSYMLFLPVLVAVKMNAIANENSKKN